MAKTVVASGRSSRWQWISIALLFLTAACFGFIGQVIEPPHPSQAFTLEWWREVSNDLFVTMLYFTFSAPVDAAGGNVYLHVARFLAPVATVSAIVKIIIQAAYTSWLQAQLKYRRGHIVIIGFGNLGQQIARHFKHHGVRIVALDRFPTTEATEMSDHLKIPLIVGDGTNVHDLTEVAASHASAIFFVTDNDVVNLEASAAASSLMSATDKHRTRLLVHLGNLELSRQLEDFERRIAFIGDRKTSVSFFNVNDLLARQLLAQTPLFEIARTLCQSRVHILVIGLNDISERIIQHTMLTQRTTRLGRPIITIVDANAAQLEEQSHIRYPGLKDVATINYIAKNPRVGNLQDLIKSVSEAAPLTATILCLPNEVDNLAAALEIHAVAGRGLIHAGQILVRRNQTSDFFELLSRIERYDLANMLADFGEGDHALFLRQISGDDDRIATALHNAYCEERRQAGDPPSPSTSTWDELAESSRRANRRAADHLWTKLATAGYKIDKRTLGFPALFDRGAQFRDPKVRAILGHLEHDRWWTDRVIDGWQFGATRDNEARKHPGLIPFEDLTFDEQEKDAEQVDSLADLFDKAPASKGGALQLQENIGVLFTGSAQGEGQSAEAIQTPQECAEKLVGLTDRQHIQIYCLVPGEEENAWLMSFEAALAERGRTHAHIRLFSPGDAEGYEDEAARDNDLWLNLKVTGDDVKDGYPEGLTVEAYLARQCEIILYAEVD